MTPNARATVLRVLTAADAGLTLQILWRVDTLSGFDVPATVEGLANQGLVTLCPDTNLIHITALGRCGLSYVDRAQLRGAVGRAARDSSCVPVGAVAEMLLDGCEVEPDSSVVQSLVEMAAHRQRLGEVNAAIDVLCALEVAFERGVVVSPVVRVLVISRLGFLLRFDGRIGEAAALAVRATSFAQASGDGYALAAAALAWRPESINVSDDPRCVALIDDVLARADVTEPAVRACLLAARADASLFTDLVGAQRDAAEALEISRCVNDHDTFIGAAYAYRVAHWHPSRQSELLALGSEMVARSPGAVDRAEFGAVTRLQVFLETGDWAHLDYELGAMTRRLAVSPRPLESLWHDVTLAARAQTRGAWEHADQLIHSGLGIAQGSEYSQAIQLLLTQQLLSSWHRGDDLSSLAAIDVAPAGPMRAGWDAFVLAWNCTRLPVREVTAELDRLVGHGLDALRPDLTFGPVSACLAIAAAEADSARHARLLYRDLVVYADQWAATGGAVVVGPFAWHLGRLATVLGRYVDAHDHLTAALASSESGGCTVWTARCELAIAQLHARSGRAASTIRRHARRAAELASTLGMTEVAGTAQLMLGGAVRPAGLSTREVEVLRCLTTGATNQNIADALHVSIKTIERHLLNAYRKAGLRNRAEAATFVVRELTDE
jgi:DNA-binding CsgD family transcriptional regulator